MWRTVIGWMVLGWAACTPTETGPPAHDSGQDVDSAADSDSDATAPIDTDPTPPPEGYPHGHGNPAPYDFEGCRTTCWSWVPMVDRTFNDDAMEVRDPATCNFRGPMRGACLGGTTCSTALPPDPGADGTESWGTCTGFDGSRTLRVDLASRPTVPVTIRPTMGGAPWLPQPQYLWALRFTDEVTGEHFEIHLDTPDAPWEAELPRGIYQVEPRRQGSPGQAGGWPKWPQAGRLIVADAGEVAPDFPGTVVTLAPDIDLPQEVLDAVGFRHMYLTEQTSGVRYSARFGVFDEDNLLVFDTTVPPGTWGIDGSVTTVDSERYELVSDDLLTVGPPGPPLQWAPAMTEAPDTPYVRREITGAVQISGPSEINWRDWDVHTVPLGDDPFAWARRGTLDEGVFTVRAEDDVPVDVWLTYDGRTDDYRDLTFAIPLAKGVPPGQDDLGALPIPLVEADLSIDVVGGPPQNVRYRGITLVRTDGSHLGIEGPRVGPIVLKAWVPDGSWDGWLAFVSTSSRTRNRVLQAAPQPHHFPGPSGAWTLSLAQLDLDVTVDGQPLDRTQREGRVWMVRGSKPLPWPEYRIDHAPYPRLHIDLAEDPSAPLTLWTPTGTVRLAVQLAPRAGLPWGMHVHPPLQVAQSQVVPVPTTSRPVAIALDWAGQPLFDVVDADPDLVLPNLLWSLRRGDEALGPDPQILDQEALQGPIATTRVLTGTVLALDVVCEHPDEPCLPGMSPGGRWPEAVSAPVFADLRIE